VTTNNQALAAAVTSDPRWAAVVARDARAEGTFFYSVKKHGRVLAVRRAAPASPDQRTSASI